VGLLVGNSDGFGFDETALDTKAGNLIFVWGVNMYVLTVEIASTSPEDYLYDKRSPFILICGIVANPNNPKCNVRITVS
jgi:hypothetical protein